MKVRTIVFLTGLLFLVTVGCNKRITNPPDTPPADSSRIQVPVIGTDSNLEYVSWNMENFPKLNDQTIEAAKEIMLDLNADLYAVEEIADTTGFRKLVDGLKDYNCTYSTDTYGSSYQKTGVIYRKGMITISDKKMLFENDYSAFPRPPMQLYITATHNGKSFTFTLIVLHLKAMSGQENEARRRAACEKLKNYLDEQLQTNPDKQFIVSGDWNDILTDPASDNVFQVFLNDSLNYHFLTRNIAQNPNANATYIGSFRSVIDHILVTSAVLPEYQPNSTEVLKLDEFFNGYENEVSDHRPVAAFFPVF